MKILFGTGEADYFDEIESLKLQNSTKYDVKNFIGKRIEM
jgi:hypothetical protein